MIPCTDFIPAYSELFNYLSCVKGEKEVYMFWNYLSDKFLTNLRDEVKHHGISGCWNYWKKTLNEEAAGFMMELDEKNGVFKIIMHKCPSKGRLLKYRHIKPYKKYCYHCDVLYRRVLEPLGYNYEIDLSKSDKAKCKITIKKI